MGFKRNHSISYLINHIAVCRTAATLPVLLKYITTVCSGTYKADSASSWELSGCQTDEVKCMSTVRLMRSNVCPSAWSPHSTDNIIP